MKLFSKKNLNSLLIMGGANYPLDNFNAFYE